MATMTPTDINSLPEYTAAQMLKFFKYQLVRIAGEGHSFTIDGRSGEEATQYVESQIRFWQVRADQEAQSAGAGANGSGNVLVRIVR
jgi:hypothetical protein